MPKLFATVRNAYPGIVQETTMNWFEQSFSVLKNIVEYLLALNNRLEQKFLYFVPENNVVLALSSLDYLGKSSRRDERKI